jgi:cob(I)alamin adenosyltransferase
MKIYTKGGDQGHTQIYVDKVQRLPKSDAVLDCYGTLDELNAHLGLLLSYINEYQALPTLSSNLVDVQRNLFQIGFAISAKTSLSGQDVENLEQLIDDLQASLSPQTHFILPGGSLCAAQAHVCRTVARRAERQLVKLLSAHPVPEVCLQYLNRLSDYFFVVARSLNQAAGTAETQV